MSSPFVGEIRMVGFSFAPLGWAFCDGTLMSISQNDVLFTLIGTTYGGDGQNTFALPDLRSRVPVHAGHGYTQGQAGGAETVTLTVAQLPAHVHVPQADAANGTSNSPAGAIWAQSPSSRQHAAGTSANASLNMASMTTAGGSQPHDNMLPYLAINFIIALEGVFPSQN